MKAKVFCIGFHKTGTSTLGEALGILGYRVTGPNGVHDPDIGQNVLPMVFELVTQFDAFQDNPWPIVYKKLDVAYPGSKFILLTRDSASWIKSQVSHFGKQETPMRTWIYGAGCPEGNESTYIERFEDHNRDVLQYFENRPHDLLVMDLTRGDGWEKLCHFLDADNPSEPFPHANKASDRQTELSDK